MGLRIKLLSIKNTTTSTKSIMAIAAGVFEAMLTSLNTLHLSHINIQVLTVQRKSIWASITHYLLVLTHEKSSSNAHHGAFALSHSGIS